MNHPGKRLVGSMMIALLTVALSACPDMSGARSDYGASGPRVLMMTEDGDRDTVPRNSRVNKRVLAALQEELDQSGLKIYDETALTLDTSTPGRQRRSDAELVDVARATRQVDVLAVYSIYASAQPVDYMTKIRVRVSGRMFDVNSSRMLGSFESELPGFSSAPANCSRECVLENMGKDAKAIAQNLGDALQAKLNRPGNADVRRDRDGGWRAGGSDGYAVEYKITLDGFTAREMDDFEDLMVQKFRGYRSHRSIDTQSKRRTYIYESSSESSALERNLRRSLDHLDAQGQVQFSNNAYVVTKIGLRNSVRDGAGDRW